MDFSDSAEEAKFRAEAAEWLQANAPTDDEIKGLDEMAQAKLWQKRKVDAGWACIRWPKEYGGRGATAIEQVILNDEQSKVKSPSTQFFSIGQGMAAPTLMTWATEEQKRRYLPKLASGEEIWCQLFSEPAGGSDLAALRTRAVKDGDDWVINGQKIWTSGAHYSDWGILVVRTDPDVPKHQGLTYFFVNMHSPGVEIKPIKQLSSASNFNEVYFTDVRIPDEQRLGAVGQGWQVALTTLMNERASIGGTRSAGQAQSLLKLAATLEIDGEPASKNKAVRSRVADWYAKEAGLRFTGYRSMTAMSRGEVPGPENSIGKLVAAPMAQDLASFALELQAQAGVIYTPLDESFDNMFQHNYMNIPGGRIAGGTDEIMANIIAERVLGLPQEPRVDKGIPFSDVPTSGGKS